MTPELVAAYRFHRADRRWPLGTRRPLTAGAALELARRDVAEGKRRYPARGPIGWGNRRSEDGAVWVESLADAGLRFVGYADELASLRHRGWFADSFQDTTYRGAVLQLPGRGGRNRYLAAYEDPHNSGVYLVDLSRPAVFEGEGGDYYPSNRIADSGAHEAALAADSFAERHAERAREYDEAWQAGRQWADLGEQIRRTVAEVHALVADLKRARKDSTLADSGRLCAVIREKIATMVRDIREARAERDRLAAGDAEPWIFWPGDPDLRAAFNDGAGEAVLSIAK